MKKAVSLGELLVASIALFLAGIGAYVNIKQTQASQEVKIQTIETNYQGIKQDLKELKDLNTQILVKLQDKQDRK